MSIGSKLPEEYLPEVEERYPGALASQFIPMDTQLWKLERHRDFLRARRELLADGITLRAIASKLNLEKGIA